MNRSYNIVWNAARNMYVVASELARGDSRIQGRVRAAAVGLLLSGIGYANAAEVGPQSGASISLQDGDTVTVTTGGIGVDSTVAGGSGLQIDGKAVINVSGGASSTGIKLDNGVNNDLGIDTEIHVAGTGFGLYLGRNNIGTSVSAEGLLIDVVSDGNAYGIFSGVKQGALSLGKGSSITVKSSSSFANGIYLDGSNSSGSLTLDAGLIRAEAAGQATGLNAEFAKDMTIDLGKQTRIEVESMASASTAGITLGQRSQLTADEMNIAIAGAGGSYGIKIGQSSQY